MNKNGPNVLSLFSGSGGLDEGFRATGCNIIGCVELEQWACDTIRKNYPDQKLFGPPFQSGNIKSISPYDLLSFLEIQKKQIDVVIGGPPCQPFSQAAAQRFLKTDPKFKRKGVGDNLKGTLIFDFIKILDHIRPRAFLLEQVPGFVEIDNGVQLKRVFNSIENLGYSLSKPTVLNAVDFGVPQNRKRLFIIGLLGSEGIQDLPLPTHSKVGPNRYRVVAEALLTLNKNCPNNHQRDHKSGSILRYKTLKFGEREKKGRVDRLDPLQPSKTVIAGGMHGGGRSHLHPFIPRTLTVRECARLQTYPDSFQFEGSIARQFTQVGNSVPPLLAEVLAKKLIFSAFKIESSDELKFQIDTKNIGHRELFKKFYNKSKSESSGILYDNNDFFSELDERMPMFQFN